MYNINYINLNIDMYTCKYFQNIYCMCVYLINIHRTHTHYALQTKTFILDAINRLTALDFIQSYCMIYTTLQNVWGQ